jgi:hypothetical protein
MEVITVRALIERLTELAAGLPDGLDSAVDLAICDGESLLILSTVDVDVPSEVQEDPPGEVGRQSVMIRGNHYPGGDPGEVYRGLVVDADEELRKLTEDP